MKPDLRAKLTAWWPLLSPPQLSQSPSGCQNILTGLVGESLLSSSHLSKSWKRSSEATRAYLMAA
jgi:hypothetical protein